MAAPVLGHLGQSNPGAVTTALYTVPAARRAVVSSLVIANTTAAPINATVYSCINGAAAATGNVIVPTVSIPANTHQALTEGWTLAAADVIRVLAGATGLVFTLYGEETDVPTA